MPTQFNIQQLTRAWFLCSLFIFGIAACASMKTMEADLDAGFWAYATVAAFFVWGLSGVLLYFPDYCLYKPSLPILCYALFLLWTFVPTMAYGKEETTTKLITDLCWILLPLLVLFGSYNTVRNYGPSKWDVPAFCLLSLMVAGQYYLIFRELNIFLEHSHLACSYFALYLLPLTFLSKSKAVRIIFAIIAIIVVVSSVKRGGVLALILALFIYIACWAFVAKKLRFSTIAIGIVGLALFGTLVFMAGVSDENNNVFERFENVEEDQGSNRVVVWGMSAAMIAKSEGVQLLAGHGYNSVLADSPTMLSAHNDFIEVTYDYGVIGIVLYILSIIVTLFYLLIMIRRKSEYAPPLAMMMVAYLLLSMMSHVIIYFFANVVMLTIGYIIGRYEYDKMIQDSEPEYYAKD